MAGASSCMVAGNDIVFHAVENKCVLGFAQTHQGRCPWTLPPLKRRAKLLTFFQQISHTG